MLEELGSIQSRMAEIQSRLDALSPAAPNAAPFADSLREAQQDPLTPDNRATFPVGGVPQGGVGTILAPPLLGAGGAAGPGGASDGNIHVTPAALGPLPSHLTPLPVSPANVVPLQTGTASDVNGLAETYAAKHGLPASLVKAIIQTESGGNPRAVSRAGAMGLMQLMPANVKEAGIADPFDPEQNIAAGTAQLSGLMQQYGGDVDLALAGYNAGPGNVKKYGGVPPFRETQNYIHRVRALMEKE